MKSAATVPSDRRAAVVRKLESPYLEWVSLCEPHQVRDLGKVLPSFWIVPHDGLLYAGLLLKMPRRARRHVLRNVCLYFEGRMEAPALTADELVDAGKVRGYRRHRGWCSLTADACLHPLLWTLGRPGSLAYCGNPVPAYELAHRAAQSGGDALWLSQALFYCGQSQWLSELQKSVQIAERAVRINALAEGRAA